MRQLLLQLLSFLGKKLRRTPLTKSELANKIHRKLALWLYGSLHGANEAKAGPFHVHFDPRDQVIAKRLVLYGSFEEQEIKLLCSFCKPGDCVMDIGANIGIYSLNLSRAVGPEGRVIAVEPDPDNLRLLRKNLEINSCHNVVVVPCGLGEDSGSAELYQPEENRGALSLVDVRGTGKSVRVPIRRAEDVLAELKMTPIVVKIDTEGAEPSIIAGFGETMPKVFLFEFDPPLISLHGHDPSSYLTGFISEGYSVKIINKDDGSLSEILPGAIKDLVDTMTVRSLSYNLLAVRG